jgi:hypothetical protein
MMITVVLVFLLSACGGDDVIYNFEARRDGTLISSDKEVIIEYTTDVNGRLISLNIDHLLTIEEMFLLNPVIDPNIEIDGFDGDVFVKPRNECTLISNDVYIPVNLEIGNTRYKYDDTNCQYRTVDTNNNFRAGFAEEYYIFERIQEDRQTIISVIIYQPDELVKFVELYTVPHTFELLGVYHLAINQTRQDVIGGVMNYYNDTSMYEQLYLKHQENDATIAEINGMSEELNLLDLTNISDVQPLIENFETRYASEIAAIEELQEHIGINFPTDEEVPTEDLEGNN